MAAREAQVPSQNGGEMVEIGEVRAVQNGPLASAPDQAPAAPPVPYLGDVLLLFGA